MNCPYTMIYVQPLDIPANTPASAPLTATMQLSSGTITLVAIQFPSGVNALAHLQIWNGLHQLFPTNQDGDFATGAETIVWDEQEVLELSPFALTLIGWNTDTVYDHTITVRIAMAPLVVTPSPAGEITKLLGTGGTGVEGPLTYPLINP